MVILYTDNTTPNEKYQSEEEVEEEYLSFLMLYGSDNRQFRIIKTDLENNMMCGSDSYPKFKEKLWFYSTVHR